jgi:lipoprotein-releasing system ATP-binding protein
MSKNTSSVLVLKNIKKSYQQGHVNLHILKGASLEIKPGKLTALVGPSGSGKSTLLQMAGLLDNPDSGKIFINGTDCSQIKDAGRTSIRRDTLGFVYQFHHLLGEFSALENVMIPQTIRRVSKQEAEHNAAEILHYFGLKSRLHHRPSELSGGEQQRVAIARAIVNKPSLLLADEPTGNLDPTTASEVLDVLLKASQAMDLAALIVTHNYDLANRLDHIVALEDGKIVQHK